MFLPRNKKAPNNRCFMDGAGSRDRTDDEQLGRLTLLPLSYTRVTTMLYHCFLKRKVFVLTLRHTVVCDGVVSRDPALLTTSLDKPKTFPLLPCGRSPCSSVGAPYFQIKNCCNYYQYQYPEHFICLGVRCTKFSPPSLRRE